MLCTVCDLLRIKRLKHLRLEKRLKWVRFYNINIKILNKRANVAHGNSTQSIN